MGRTFVCAEGQGEAALDDGREALEEGGGPGNGFWVNGFDGIWEGVVGDRVVPGLGDLLLLGEAGLLFTGGELVGFPGEASGWAWLEEQGHLLQQLRLQLKERLTPGIKAKVKDR